MQKSKHNFFRERSVFYASFPICEQAVKGDWDYNLKAVYMVGVLDFVFDENKDSKDYYHTEVKLMDVEKKTVFYDKLTFIFLEIPKFNKTPEQLETRFDKWLYLLKHLPRLQKLPVKLQERIFEKACRIAEIAKMTKAEMAEYENSLKVYRDWYSTITTARAEGKAEGKAEGLAEGIEKGKAEGLAEGIEKGKAETAMKMIEDGMAIDTACKYTGLTGKQIEQLINNIQ
jgi:predicted transposase/invertase (TIGR01784 family)